MFILQPNNFTDRLDQNKAFQLVCLETRPLAASWELLKPRPDQESSAIEIEIRERRIAR